MSSSHWSVEPTITEQLEEPMEGSHDVALSSSSLDEAFLVFKRVNACECLLENCCLNHPGGVRLFATFLIWAAFPVNAKHSPKHPRLRLLNCYRTWGRRSSWPQGSMVPPAIVVNMFFDVLDFVCYQLNGTLLNHVVHVLRTALKDDKCVKLTITHVPHQF